MGRCRVGILEDLFKDLAVFKYYQPNDIVRVMGHGQQLKQALAHVIAHCVGEISRGGDLFVTVEHDRKWVEISIRHSGRGLTTQESMQLFKPFFKTSRFKCGLDLVLAQAVIFQHGGRIQVESEVDVGTEFLIELPIV